MLTEMKKALIADLLKLHGELPFMIHGVLTGDGKTINDALALIKGSSEARFNVAMDRLTTHVFDEAQKGNREPLRKVASGEAFNELRTEYRSEIAKEQAK